MLDLLSHLANPFVLAAAVAVPSALYLAFLSLHKSMARQALSNALNVPESSRRESLYAFQQKFAADTAEKYALFQESMSPVNLPVFTHRTALVNVRDHLRRLADALHAHHNNNAMIWRVPCRLAPMVAAEKTVRGLATYLQRQTFFPPSPGDAEVANTWNLLVGALNAVRGDGTPVSHAVLFKRVETHLQQVYRHVLASDKGMLYRSEELNRGIGAQDATYSFSMRFLCTTQVSISKIKTELDTLAMPIATCLAMATPHCFNAATQNGPALLRNIAALRDRLHHMPNDQLIRVAKTLNNTPRGDRNLSARVCALRDALAPFFENNTSAQILQDAPAWASFDDAQTHTSHSAPAALPDALVPQGWAALPPLEGFHLLATRLRAHPRAPVRDVAAAVLPPLSDIQAWLAARPQDEHLVAGLVDSAAPRAAKALAVYARLCAVDGLDAGDRLLLADAEDALAQIPRLLRAYHRALLAADFKALAQLVQEMRLIDFTFDAPAGFTPRALVPA